MASVGAADCPQIGKLGVILTDREIEIAIQRGLLKIQPQPNFEDVLSSTSIDLTLDANLRIFRSDPARVRKPIDPTRKGYNFDEAVRAITDARTIPSAGYLLEPKILVLAWTAEYIELATETRIAARVEGKSSLARLGLGVHVTAPTIHAGFKGQIQLEMINHGALPIRLKPRMRICQLIFETTLGTPVRGYAGQFVGQTAPKRKGKKAA